MSRKIRAIIYGCILVAIFSSAAWTGIQLFEWTKPIEIEKIRVREGNNIEDVTGTINLVQVGPEIVNERNLFNIIVTPLPTPTKPIKPTPTPTKKPWAVMWLVEGTMGDCAIIRDYTLYSYTLCIGEVRDNVKIISVNDYDQTVTIEFVESGERVTLQQGVERVQ